MNTLKVLSRYAFIFMALFLAACENDDESTDGGDDPMGAGKKVDLMLPRFGTAGVAMHKHDCLLLTPPGCLWCSY